MLTQIYVKNFVLIDAVRLDLDSRMSVFTGETGAGKSLLIDAIGLLCGQRASAGYVKRGAQRAIIEGVFSLRPNSRAAALLAQQGFELEDDELIISREITAEGKSSVRLNQRAITAAFLRELSTELIDIHSQHDNQYLLQSRYHLQLLDRYCEDERLLQTVRDAYRAYHDLQVRMDKLQNEELNEEDLDELTEQLNEIDDAHLRKDEPEELETRIHELNRAETVKKQVSSALELLDGERGSNPALYQAMRALENISDLESIAPHANALSDAYYEIEEHIAALQDVLAHMDDDEQLLNEMQERLFLYHRLYRRYGGSYEDVMAHRDACEARIDRILHRQDHIDTLQQQLRQAQAEYEAAAARLHELRVQKAVDLEEQVMGQLRDLMLEHARFHICITPARPSASGSDAVEFQVAMNRAQAFTPLHKSASGGELSRLMLGLKCVFTHLQGIETVIFDEIDTGVSGRVAMAIGRKMQQLAQDTQVLCVTHLAQVAACADQHLLVQKQDDGSVTSTSIHVLESDARIRQLALIASGSVSSASLQAARELLESARR